jgi:hypothetical protein
MNSPTHTVRAITKDEVSTDISLLQELVELESFACKKEQQG